jgi:hypothetical protein
LEPNLRIKPRQRRQHDKADVLAGSEARNVTCCMHTAEDGGLPAGSTRALPKDTSILSTPSVLIAGDSLGLASASGPWSSCNPKPQLAWFGKGRDISVLSPITLATAIWSVF